MERKRGREGKRGKAMQPSCTEPNPKGKEEGKMEGREEGRGRKGRVKN